MVWTRAEFYLTLVLVLCIYSVHIVNTYVLNVYITFHLNFMPEWKRKLDIFTWQIFANQQTNDL